MSLFPAYAPVSDGGAAPHSDDDVAGYVPTAPIDLDVRECPVNICVSEEDLGKEVDDIHSPPAAANSTDEAKLLETSSESSHSGDDASSASKRRKLNPFEPAAKKKKRSKHKKRSREKKKEKQGDSLISESDDFYLDKKPDAGNLYVSTLYYPARPEYHQSRRGIEITLPNLKKSKKRWKRYFEVDFRFINDKNYNTEAQEGEVDNKMGEFEKIGDSKRRWDDSRTEKELTERTAYFNKHLGENPHDVDMWLEFVKFQENRYSYDVLNYRAVSESSARDVCRQKQLSILDTALNHNQRNPELLDAKLQLARLSKPAQEYLAMVKDLIAAESDSDTLARLWCALTEGVFSSAALCSAAAVRDTYATAATALRRDQRAYLELLYRYGLFLRHAGLNEQLHLLLDLVTAMNFAPRTDAFQCDSDERIAVRETKLADEEAKLIASGLPLSAVWARVERARGAVHWRAEPAGGRRAADPQRWPDAADVADLLAPVTRPNQLFTLAVHVLRLARVPLLPGDGCSGALLRALHPLTGAPPAWEGDAADALLPLLVVAPRPDACASLLARHAARPHYFQRKTGYLEFVEKLFAACLEWTAGRERLAILVWWIRFHATLLAIDSENRAEAVRVRKLLQQALKLHGESPLAFAEFSRLERAACGVERARQVALAALRSADAASRAERLAIARCVCDVDGDSAAGAAAGVWALVCATLGRSLPLDVSAPPSTQLLQDAFAECEQRCGDLWAQGCEDTQLLEPASCLLPADDSEWWACRYRLLARLRPACDMTEEHGDLERIGSEAKTPRALRMHEAASVALVAEAGRGRPMLARRSLARHPHCAALAVAAAERPAAPALPPPPPPSATAALACVLPLLLACEEGEGWARAGAGRRALAALRAATAPEAAGARCPLLWRLRLEAEAQLDGGRAGTALYLALDACVAAKELYVEGARAAPGEFAELTDLLLEKQLRLHALPEELAPI